MNAGFSVYGILKPCYRCVYQHTNEPILIFSKHRGPRVIIIPDKGKAYVRKGKCIGFEKCGKCFEAIESDKYPCDWREI